MKKAANRKRPAVNKVYYIYVGILAVLFFICQNTRGAITTEYCRNPYGT